MNTKEKQDLIELLVKVVTRAFGPEVTPYEKERIWVGCQTYVSKCQQVFFESCRHLEFLNIILMKR